MITGIYKILTGFAAGVVWYLLTEPDSGICKKRTDSKERATGEEENDGTLGTRGTTPAGREGGQMEPERRPVEPPATDPAETSEG